MRYYWRTPPRYPSPDDRRGLVGVALFAALLVLVIIHATA